MRSTVQVERTHLLRRQPLRTTVRLRCAVHARLPLRQVLRRLPEPAALGPEAMRQNLAVHVGGRAQQPRDEQMTQDVRGLFWWGLFWWRGNPTSNPNQAAICGRSRAWRRSCASDAATRVEGWCCPGSGRMHQRRASVHCGNVCSQVADVLTYLARPYVPCASIQTVQTKAVLSGRVFM